MNTKDFDSKITETVKKITFPEVNETIALDVIWSKINMRTYQNTSNLLVQFINRHKN